MAAAVERRPKIRITILPALGVFVFRGRTYDYREILKKYGLKWDEYFYAWTTLRDKMPPETYRKLKEELRRLGVEIEEVFLEATREKQKYRDLGYLD